MKKICFLLLVALAIISCSTDEVFSERAGSRHQNMQKYRSIEEAVDIAQNAIGMLQEVSTRVASREVSLADIQYVLSPATKGNTENDTLLYIVNYANGEGFAIISANRNAEGLLAVTEKGTYRTGESCYAENKGFTSFMEWAKKYSSLIPVEEDNGFVLKEHKIVVDTISSERIPNKVEVQWGQTGVEGKYAPNSIAGCSNTAMAQIMSYFCYPSKINITYPGASVNSQTLDWSAIKEHKITHGRQSCTATEEAHEAISQLLRQLGEMNKSDYEKPDVTVTYDSSVRNSFIKLGYQISNFVSYKYESLSQFLRNGSLLYMSGVVKDKDIGHVWLVDGSYCYTIHQTEWERPTGQVWRLIRDMGNKTREFLHINWGWNGDCNGLFLLGNLAPGNGNYYDNAKYNSNSNNYTESLHYLVVNR